MAVCDGAIMKKMLLIILLTLVIIGGASGAIYYVEFYEDDDDDDDDKDKKKAPTAVMDIDPSEPLVDEEVTFSGNASTLPEGVSGNLTFEWDFGDDAGSSAKWVKHTYSEAGVYTVTLEVTAPNGKKDIATKAIKVKREDYSDTESGSVSGTDDAYTMSFPVDDNATQVSVTFDLTNNPGFLEPDATVHLELVNATDEVVQEQSGVDENGDSTWSYNEDLSVGTWEFTITCENDGTMDYTITVDVSY